MPKTQLLCKDDMYANPWLIQLKLFETGAQNNFNKLLQKILSSNSLTAK
jgi:hypothetical protein